MTTVSFQLNGEQMTLTVQQVRDAARSATPEPPRLHVVDVQGSIYPVKQVFSAATGLDRLDFTTNQARTILKRLGFKVTRVDEAE